MAGQLLDLRDASAARSPPNPPRRAPRAWRRPRRASTACRPRSAWTAQARWPDACGTARVVEVSRPEVAVDGASSGGTGALPVNEAPEVLVSVDLHAQYKTDAPRATAGCPCSRASRRCRGTSTGLALQHLVQWICTPSWPILEGGLHGDGVERAVPKRCRSSLPSKPMATTFYRRGRFCLPARTMPTVVGLLAPKMPLRSRCEASTSVVWFQRRGHLRLRVEGPTICSLELACRWALKPPARPRSPRRPRRT